LDHKIPAIVPVLFSQDINTTMKESKKSSGRGGARPGAGRPRGTTDRVTVAGLLQSIEQLNGRSYVDILADDFTQARLLDRNLAMKYHHLIMSKVAATLNTVEVSDTADAVQQKQAAFAEAIAQIAGIRQKQ